MKNNKGKKKQKDEYADFQSNKDLIDKTLHVLTILIILTMLFQYNFVIYKNTTPSMYPTIEVGDYLFSTYRVGRVKRGDIVSFKEKYGEEIYTKRVIGLPNETIEIYGQTIYINGEKFDDPYIYPQSLKEEYDQYDLERLKQEGNYSFYKTNDEEYFVMGDNREISLDSRDFGSISYDEIISQVIKVIK